MCSRARLQLRISLSLSSVPTPSHQLTVCFFFLLFRQALSSSRLSCLRGLSNQIPLRATLTAASLRATFVLYSSRPCGPRAHAHPTNALLLSSMQPYAPVYTHGTDSRTRVAFCQCMCPPPGRRLALYRAPMLTHLGPSDCGEGALPTRMSGYGYHLM